MKLTPENKKALEERVKAIRETAYDLQIPLGVEDKAAALLLEIWEPLAEMVEARASVTDNEFVFENKEDAMFMAVCINRLAAIRKAVGDE